MSFPNDYYVIKHLRSNKIVSRHVVEDRSLLPKRVLVLPDGVADIHNLQWLFESLGSGNYHLSNRGGTASVINDNIYGNILPSQGNDVWQFRPGPGSNVYQIINSDGVNWTVPNTDDFSQVATSPSPDFFVITPCLE
ncbi:hypothetical protein FIBSPDRAFT_853722 [Athelia psychrophila]|uniref:Ricin B lectin domain-containing protein n=1 Tax=Athelia psychrophila TaxID=1759441 RepID=A0A166QGE5_9AGAM|nr:hypothetical protein FIBSPDRAFT_853722 [Fibularhizoctonia sp. CBS 109695]